MYLESTCNSLKNLLPSGLLLLTQNHLVNFVYYRLVMRVDKVSFKKYLWPPNMAKKIIHVGLR